jgi:hypothetical protein
MKLTKSKLKQLIKEELAAIQEACEACPEPAARVADAIGISLDKLTAALEAEGLAIVGAEEAAPEMTPDEKVDYEAAAERKPAWDMTKGGHGGFTGGMGRFAKP